jgi:outer membrane lipoprotein-sorting protein
VDRRTFLRLAAAGSALGLVGGVAPAAADELSPALITRARQGLKSAIAKFTQVRTVGLLATDVKSQGTMTVVTPDRLRWELAPPDAVTYWIGPEGIAYRTEKGVVRAGKEAAGRFGAVLTDLLVFLGGDLSKLEARYAVTIPSREKDGALNLVAEPRTDDVRKLVRAVRVQTTPELWSVRRVEIEEAGGDRTVLTFGPAQRDPQVDPATMRPPA